MERSTIENLDFDSHDAVLITNLRASLFVGRAPVNDNDEQGTFMNYIRKLL